MKIKTLAITTVLLLIAVMFTMVANTTADNVEPDWVAYEDRRNYYDYGRDVAVDSLGNVFVVGYADPPYSSYEDATIVKYDTDGNLQWVRYYNGPANRYDYAYAVTVDNLGNCYVAGRGYRSYYQSYDYMTLKYDTNGNLRWARFYNGPTSSSDYVDYWGQPVQYDSGRVYVTGYSYGYTRYDVATVCYDANSGAQLWVQRYNGPYNRYDYGRSLVIANGMCYVAGYGEVSYSNYNIYTLAYNAVSGAPMWFRNYHGGYDDDYGYDICADSSGRVFVGGYIETWSQGYNFATLAYNGATGSLLWARSYHGGYSSDYGRGINCNNAGVVFMTGYGYSTYSSRYDLHVVAYNAATGSQLWRRTYDGPRSYSYEYAYNKPEIDPNGNVVVPFHGDGETNSYDDLLVVSYDSAGNELWFGRFNGAQGRYEYCYGAAVDAEGSVYAAGYGSPPTGYYRYYDIMTMKFASAIPANVDMEPNSLNLESNGNWVSFKVYEFPDNPELTPYDVEADTCSVAGAGADLKFGTYNNNKFIGKADRLMVQDAIGGPGDEVEVDIKGKADGTSFRGTAIIKAIQN
jgi:hypothetical protein